MNNFKKFNFQPWIIKKLDDLGFTNPTPVQEEAIPIINKNQYVVINSATGSGKTLAFMLPIINDIDPEIKEVQAIVISPSRELSKQIYKVTDTIIEDRDDLKVDLITGGQNIANKNLRSSNIIVGTAAKIKQVFSASLQSKITNAKYLVIDEADMTIDHEFFDDLNFLIQKINKNIKVIICSATIPKELTHFMQKFFQHPFKIIASTKRLSSINHIIINTKVTKKMDNLDKLINVINPYIGIIFVSTKNGVKKVHNHLLKQNIKSAIIHGDLTHRERNQILRRIRNMEFQWIVASDVLSRGLDIDGLDVVINFDLPNNIEFYQHRAGRTSRYYNSGTSYSLVDLKNHREMMKLKKIGFEYKIMKFVKEELIDFYNAEMIKEKRIDKKEKLSTKKLDRFDVQIRQMKNQSKKNNAKNKIKKPNYKKKLKMKIARVKKKQKNSEMKKIRKEIQYGKK